jgi:hypothetical protein
MKKTAVVVCIIAQSEVVRVSDGFDLETYAGLRVGGSP